MKDYATMLDAPDLRWLEGQIALAQVYACKTKRKKARVLFVSPQNIRLIPVGIEVAVVPIMEGMQLTGAQMNDVEFALNTKGVGVVMVTERPLVIQTLRGLFPPLESNKHPMPTAV